MRISNLKLNRLGAAGLAFAAGLMLIPSPAFADRGDWDDVRDARSDVRKEQRDVWEAQMDLRKELREGDWKGARDARKDIRKNQNELREAQRDYRRELRDARGDHRNEGHWGRNNSWNNYDTYGYGHYWHPSANTYGRPYQTPSAWNTGYHAGYGNYYAGPSYYNAGYWGSGHWNTGCRR